MYDDETGKGETRLAVKGVSGRASYYRRSKYIAPLALKDELIAWLNAQCAQVELW